MKTARFAQLVAAAGKPKVHLLLMDPKRDRDFQSALKADRVLSVHQQNVGTKKDVGSVGYDGDGPVQVMVFPKSLKQFAGARIVGINYDLMEEEAKAPRPRSGAPAKSRISKAPSPPPPPSRPKSKAAASKEEEVPPEEPPPAVAKVKAAEPEPEPEPEPPRRETSRGELVAGIRRALKALDDGKQVAAYRTLEQLL